MEIFTLLTIYNNRIRKVNSTTGIITTIAGNGTAWIFRRWWTCNKCYIKQSFGVAVDSNGNIYIADTYNNRIRKVNSTTGIITTIAGNGTGGYSGDGGIATNATLYHPFGVAVDSNGNIYIADHNNNRIRKVNSTTGIITTIAGNGTAGYSGDGGIATNAQLYYPYWSSSGFKWKYLHC